MGASNRRDRRNLRPFRLISFFLSKGDEAEQIPVGSDRKYRDVGSLARVKCQRNDRSARARYPERVFTLETLGYWPFK